MKRTLFYCLTFMVFLALAVTAFSPCEASEKEKQFLMRVGTPTTNDPQVYEMEQFKKLLGEKVGDRIKVELYPSGQLGSNSDMLQGVTAGSIQGLLEPTSFLSGFDVTMNVVELPYYFPDVWTTARLFNGPVGDVLRDHLAERGLVATSFYPYSELFLLLKFPLEKMADLKGKKIRVLGTKLQQDMIAAFGGVGVPMDVPELYIALQQGVIDGVLGGRPFFWTLKYYDIAKYLFTEPNTCAVTVFLVNKKWLDGLPADLRTAVIKTAEEIQPLAEKFARGAGEKANEVMQANGVKIINASPELKAQMKEACGPAVEKFFNENPGAKQMYERLNKAMSK